MTTKFGQWWYADARKGLRDAVVAIILVIGVLLILAFCLLLVLLAGAGGVQFFNWIEGGLP